MEKVKNFQSVTLQVAMLAAFSVFAVRRSGRA